MIRTKCDNCNRSIKEVGKVSAYKLTKYGFKKYSASNYGFKKELFYLCRNCRPSQKRAM